MSLVRRCGLLFFHLHQFTSLQLPYSLGGVLKFRSSYLEGQVIWCLLDLRPAETLVLQQWPHTQTQTHTSAQCSSPFPAPLTFLTSTNCFCWRCCWVNSLNLCPWSKVSECAIVVVFSSGNFVAAQTLRWWWVFLALEKGRLVSQDHTATSFIAHELILFRKGEWARPAAIVGKVFWKSRRIMKITHLPCNFLILQDFVYTTMRCPPGVSHASIGMNVFTWVWLLLRSFALLGANPFSFQFSRALNFFWQVIWYLCSWAVSNGEPSYSSS